MDRLFGTCAFEVNGNLLWIEPVVDDTVEPEYASRFDVAFVASIR